MGKPGNGSVALDVEKSHVEGLSDILINQNDEPDRKFKPRSVVSALFLNCKNEKKISLVDLVKLFSNFIEEQFLNLQELEYDSCYNIAIIIISFLSALAQKKKELETSVLNECHEELSIILKRFTTALNVLLECIMHSDNIKRKKCVTRLMKTVEILIDEPTSGFSKILLPHTMSKHNSQITLTSLVLFSLCTANLLKNNNESPVLIEECKAEMLKSVLNIISNTSDADIYVFSLFKNFLFTVLSTNEEDINTILTAISRAILRKPVPALKIINIIISTQMNEELFYQLSNKLLKPILKAYSLLSDEATKKIFTSVINNICSKASNDSSNHKLVNMFIEHLENVPTSIPEARVICFNALSAIKCDFLSSKKVIEICVRNTTKREPSHDARCAIACCIAAKINSLSTSIFDDRDFFNTFSNWIKSEIVSTDNNNRFVVYLVLSQISDLASIGTILSRVKIKTLYIVEHIVKIINTFKTSKTGPLDPKSRVSYSELVFGFDWLLRILSLEKILKLEPSTTPVDYNAIRTSIYSSTNQFLNKKYYIKTLKTEVEWISFARVLVNLFMWEEPFKLDLSNLISDNEFQTLQIIGDAIIHVSCEATQHDVRESFFKIFHDENITVYNLDDNEKKYKILTNRISKLSLACMHGINSMLNSNLYNSQPPKPALAHYKDRIVLCSSNKNCRINKVVKTVFSLIGELSYELANIASYEFSYEYLNIVEHILTQWVIPLSHPSIIECYGYDYWARTCTTIPGIDIRDAVKRTCPRIIKNFLNEAEKIHSLLDDVDTQVHLHKETAVNSISSICAVEASTALSIVLDAFLKTINNKDQVIASESEIKLVQIPTKNPLSGSKGSKLTNSISKSSLRKKPQVNSISQKYKNNEEQKTNAQISKNTLNNDGSLCQKIGQDIYRNKLDTLTLFLISIVNGIGLSKNRDRLYDLEPYLYHIFTIIISYIKSGFGNHVIDNKNDYLACSHHSEIGNMVELLKRITAFVVKNSPLQCLTEPNSKLLYAILQANNLLDVASEFLSFVPALESNQISNVFEVIHKIPYNLDSPFVTSQQYMLLLQLIKPLICKNRHFENLGILSNNTIQTISRFLGVNATLSSSSFLPKEDTFLCFLQIVRNFPAHRASIVNGFISFCSAINFYMDQNEESHCNLVKPLGKYPQVPTPKEDLDKMLKLVIEGFGDTDFFVREACIIFPVLSDEECINLPSFEMWLWVAKFDDEHNVSSEASRLWDLHSKGRIIRKDSLEMLLKYLLSQNDKLDSMRKAFANALFYHKDELLTVINTLLNEYIKLVPTQNKSSADSYWIEYDEEERLTEKKSNFRLNIALILNSCCSLINEEKSQRYLFENLVSSMALSDPHPTVRAQFIKVALSVIKNAKTENAITISKVLDDSIKNAKFKSKMDLIYMKEASDILTAAIAVNLKDPDSTTIITKNLIESLSTHSKTAQITISGCLPGLVSLGGPKYRQEIIDLLLDKLFNATTVKKKTGYAYGLANVLNGAQISYLIESKALERIKNHLSSNKNDPKNQESAVIALNAISSTMGRLFEPFVADTLPLILESLSTPNKDLQNLVKSACNDIISRISVHCIKLSFPRLTAGLEDTNWKIKVGIIEVMSNMAKIKPQYISSSLQLVIPHLIASIADSHPKVHETAMLALESFGKVVNNPEIQKICPSIIKSLADANASYDTALSELMNVFFVHQIDAPSLALLIPIISKGLKAKNSSVKTKAAIIVASVAQLTDFRNLLPYLDELRKDLIELALDPDPEVRVASAKSLGTMVGKLGENYFPSLIEELEMKLRGTTDVTDRAGIAQSLSYVLAAIGTEKLQDIFYTVIKEINSQDKNIRELFTTLLMYLITAYNRDFVPYIDKTISIMSKGFADDESTYVQDASLKMGEIIIKTFFDNKEVMNSLLISLESSLLYPQWKVRKNSLLLTQILFSKILCTGQKTNEDSESKMISVTSGEIVDTQNAITLIIVCFMLRSDNTLSVRQSALTVLRLVVDNVTGFVLHNLSTLADVLINCHVRHGEYAGKLADTSLKETVKNVGSRVLDSLLQILIDKINIGDVYTKRGAFAVIESALGVAEQASVPTIFYKKFINVIEDGLLNRDSMVRDAAGRAFEPVLIILGDSVAEELTLNLLSHVENYGQDCRYRNENTLEEFEDNVISFCCSVMNLSIKSVYKMFVEILKKPPLTKFKVRALKSIISASDSFMEDQLTMTVDILFDLIKTAPEYRSEFSEALNIVLANVNQSVIDSFLLHFETVFSEDNMEQKKIYALLTKSIFSNSSFKSDICYTEKWVKLLIDITIREEDEEILEYIWDALTTLLNSTEKDSNEAYSQIFSDCLKKVGKKACFSLYKLSTTTFIKSLSSTDQEIKLTSLYGLKFVLENSPLDAFKKHLTQIMGALIRMIVGNPIDDIKVAVLESIELLLNRDSSVLNMFYPQIRRVIINSLFSTQSCEVYDQAVKCSLFLLGVEKRLDSFLSELFTNAHKSTDSDISKKFLDTLEKIVDRIVEKKIKPSSDSVQLFKNYLSSINGIPGYDKNQIKHIDRNILSI